MRETSQGRPADGPRPEPARTAGKPRRKIGEGLVAEMIDRGRTELAFALGLPGYDHGRTVHGYDRGR